MKFRVLYTIKVDKKVVASGEVTGESRFEIRDQLEVVLKNADLGILSWRNLKETKTLVSKTEDEIVEKRCFSMGGS